MITSRNVSTMIANLFSVSFKFVHLFMNYVVNLLLFYIIIFNWMDFFLQVFCNASFLFLLKHREGIIILNTVACFPSLLAK